MTERRRVGADIVGSTAAPVTRRDALLRSRAPGMASVCSCRGLGSSSPPPGPVAWITASPVRMGTREVQAARIVTE